ncbi:MAG: HNH endonuclease [Solibacillus sp.]|uniref:HNH endonuclease n=1 Tax=Solibacillus sp. TaxID=1909654 RepID=UPI003315A2B2
MTEYKTREQQQRFYNTKLWRKLSYQIKKRDNFECQECKRQGKVFIDDGSMSKTANRKKIQLITHHIKELAHHPELATDPNNLECICVNCHNREHNRYFHKPFEGKKNKWHEDERW